MTQTKNHCTGTDRKGDNIQTIQQGTMNFHRILNPIHRKLVHDVRWIQNPVTGSKIVTKILASGCVFGLVTLSAVLWSMLISIKTSAQPNITAFSSMDYRHFHFISWVSNLNWWSCCTSLNCHVLLKRDQWDWGRRLRLNRIPNALAIGCNSFSHNLLGAPNTTIWKRGSFVGFFADLQLSRLFKSRDEQYKDKERIQQLLLFLSQCVADISLLFQYNLKKGEVSAHLHLKSLQKSWRIFWNTTTRLVFILLRHHAISKSSRLLLNPWHRISLRSTCFYCSRNRIFVWPVVHDDCPFLWYTIFFQQKKLWPHLCICKAIFVLTNMAMFIRKSNKSNPHKLTVTSNKKIHRTKRNKNVEVWCPPAPKNHVKYLRASPTEMPFQNWYTANTNNFRLTDFCQVKINHTIGLSNKHRTA